MKKLFVLLLLSVSFSSFGQAVNPAVTIKNSIDTLINAGTVTSPILVVTPASTLTFQVVVTKISGTVGGSVALQGSLDGVNYFAISGASNLTLTDVASQKNLWILTGANYSYYRLLSTGSGTMRALVVAKYLHRKNF